MYIKATAGADGKAERKKEKKKSKDREHKRRKLEAGEPQPQPHAPTQVTKHGRCYDYGLVVAWGEKRMC